MLKSLQVFPGKILTAVEQVSWRKLLTFQVKASCFGLYLEIGIYKKKKPQTFDI